MVKRKNKEMDEEEIRMKIKKWEEKLTKFHQDSDESCVSAQDVPTAGPSKEAHVETVLSATEPRKESSTDEDTVLKLSEELLAALGEEGLDIENEGIPISDELVSRWTKIIIYGLNKDARQSLLKKYPLPKNFQRAAGPKLNPEMAAALSELSLKRDKRILYRQDSLGKILSCLGGVLTDLLKGNINSVSFIEHISDAAKLTADIFFHDTQSRKFFALAGANKDVQMAAKNAVTDDLLFGKDLVEKIKSAHTVQLNSQKIRKPEKHNINQKSPPPQKTPQQRPCGGQWPASQPTRYRRERASTPRSPSYRRQ